MSLSQEKVKREKTSLKQKQLSQMQMEVLN